MKDSRKIQALLDAIGNYHGAFNAPESLAYRLRNPLLIRSFGVPGKHETDSEGRRVFTSFLSGYRAGLYDLEIKLSGKSRASLRADDVLEGLLEVYEISGTAAHKTIVSFLRRALGDATIQAMTPLSYFVEGTPDADGN